MCSRLESRQNDLFNISKISHPRREFCGFETTVTGIGIDPTNSDEAFARVVTMMDAITDQGEGSTLNKEQRAYFRDVEPVYQASREALQVDYPRYNDTGRLTESADAEARFTNGGRDHYERFTELGTFVDKVTTWPKWHEERKKKKQNYWQAADLQIPECEPVSSYRLPSAEVIAAAMNRIGNETDGKYYDKISKAAVGSIAGITTVLNNYWNPDPKYDKVLFPYPSMAGSGDRMGICWALFGQAPDLSRGVGKTHSDKLYHACQGLDLTNVQNSVNECAAVEIFHSCRGSNGCKAQGGCGFVQKTTGGGLCGFAVVAAKSTDSEMGDGDLFSAPSDNKCATFGGCAVPISASQILPQDGTMELFDFVGKDHDSQSFGRMHFKKGDKVYDVAYRAYAKVMEHRGKTAPPQQDPNDLRLAFPPST